MEKLIITRTVDLINGGCNACPTVEAENYVFELNGINQALEGLDVTSLIMAVATMNGYKQFQEYDVAEDYDVYKKAGKEIAVIPEFNQVIFKKSGSQKRVLNQYKDSAELFSIVNELLIEYFEIEALIFVVK